MYAMRQCCIITCNTARQRGGCGPFSWDNLPGSLKHLVAADRIIFTIRVKPSSRARSDRWWAARDQKVAGSKLIAGRVMSQWGPWARPLCPATPETGWPCFDSHLLLLDENLHYIFKKLQFGFQPEGGVEAIWCKWSILCSSTFDGQSLFDYCDCSVPYDLFKQTQAQYTPSAITNHAQVRNPDMTSTTHAYTHAHYTWTRPGRNKSGRLCRLQYSTKCVPAQRA